jgi:hypothetical protein
MDDWTVALGFGASPLSVLRKVVMPLLESPGALIEAFDGHRWDSPPKIRFALDSPLEEAVTSELVSAQFPVIQGKYREFHWLWPQAPESGA